MATILVLEDRECSTLNSSAHEDSAVLESKDLLGARRDEEALRSIRTLHQRNTRCQKVLAPARHLVEEHEDVPAVMVDGRVAGLVKDTFSEVRVRTDLAA